MLTRLGRIAMTAACAALLAQGAAADTPSILTLNYPIVPNAGVPDNDGYLNPAAQTFQEGGMHVEGFWVKNNQLTFSPDGHTHIKFPNPYEISHGWANAAGFGPDRQGLYLRREDGGPFNLLQLDYRVVQPTATNLMIATSFDPTHPLQSQATSFPLVAQPNFQQLSTPGFTNLTEAFIAWDLGESIDNTAQLDNIVVSFPTGTCSQDVPGGVVFSHRGHNDPATEGWTVEGPATNVVVGPVSDPGVEAWSIDDNAGTAGSSRTYAYFPNPDVMCWARTSGFRVRAKVRVVDLPDSVDPSVLVSFSDSTQLFELRLGQTGFAHPIVWLSNTSMNLNSLDNGYHVYELVYDPVTATVDLVVDGVEVMSNRPGIAQNVAAPRLRFGSAYDFGIGHGNYGFVEMVLPMRCSNGVDDDGDGHADYPADPGCSSASDNSETGACGNEIDDDGDGGLDYPDDVGCTSLDDDSEHDPSLVCDDGADNDADTLADYPSDPGCASPSDPTESAACENAADDDGDGAIDYPSDPGCSSPTDDSEHAPSLACDDGADNDGDTLADYPLDPGCVSLTDPSELAACGDGADDDGDGLADFPADPGCANAEDASEHDAGLVCDDGLDNDGDLLADFPADAGCTSPSDATETAACSDGLDDDGDGLADFPADPGCAFADDDSERDAGLVCDDGLDNDGDGLADFPHDPGCAGAGDASERAPELVCDDGADNDGDLLIDFPADTGCASPTDATETETAACSDGVDDDGDGLTDFPADPGCASAEDESERAAGLVCDDGLDNDGDGHVDFPSDVGCQYPLSTRENPACQDGLDNDGDGGRDFDGGASANGGVPLGPPDANCGSSFRNRETAGACGLGFDLAIVLPLIDALRRRRRRR